MTAHSIAVENLTSRDFAAFGEVLEAAGNPDMIINAGYCERFQDIATLEFVGEGARAGLSIFRSRAQSLPCRLRHVERHPLGSQAFVPMSADPFLVVVAPDRAGKPGTPRAFLTRPGQGVNYFRNTWHGILAPLTDNALFAVVDRIGGGNNLEEHFFAEPYLINS